MDNKEGHASLLTDDSVETLQCCLHAEDRLHKGNMLLLNHTVTSNMTIYNMHAS